MATEITLAVQGTVQAEVQSRFWLAGNWRAISMLMICGYLLTQALRGLIYADVFNMVLFGLWVSGLMGYKMDGKVIEFLKELFTFGKAIKTMREEQEHEQ